MKRILFSFLFSATLFTSQAQLSVTDSLTNTQIANLLQGTGLTISNLVVNCDPAAMGQFSGTSEMSITQGLVLTTGIADSVAGPASLFAIGYTNTPGDADLDGFVTPYTTMDACVLEFDCVPVGDTLLFNFSFGSEEYPEFVGSSFNDVFAILLSGPGITGMINTAELPSGVPASINNVNMLTNASYFYDNEAGAGQYVSYDGFTTNLTSFAEVTPGGLYHFKVAIADVGDAAFDSGVFLEAFSFRSVMGTTSLTEFSKNKSIKLFPNPASETLQVTYVQNSNSDVCIRIFDATGRLVKTELNNNQSQGTYVHNFDVSDLSSGIYCVQVQNSEGLFSDTMVIK